MINRSTYYNILSYSDYTYSCIYFCLDALAHVLYDLKERYVYIFLNPLFIIITLIIILFVAIDLLYNYKRIQICKLNKDDGNNLSNTIPTNTLTCISFGCCWRYDSKKRIHGRIFVSDKNIVFYSPLSILFEDKELISKYSLFSGVDLSETTTITMEYTKISRMVRRGGSKVLRGSVTIELHAKDDNNNPIEIMFCHFLHTKYVYDLLSKLCTFCCSRMHHTIQNDKLNGNLIDCLNKKELPNNNFDLIEKLKNANNGEFIIPNNTTYFPLYELYDKNTNSNSGNMNSNVIEFLSKNSCQEFEEYINEYDCNSIPTSSLQNVFPCIIMPIDLKKVFDVLCNTSLDNKRNVYLRYLQLSGASNIEIECKPLKYDFMKHIIYKYEKSLNIGGVSLSWLSSKGSITFKCIEELKLYYLGDDLGVLLCIDVNSTGIPENDAFTINIRHRFTPFNTKEYVQLDVECEVTFLRFSFFKIPVIQNTIDQTKKNLEFLRSSWRMHF